MATEHHFGTVPSIRLTSANAEQVHARKGFVLYWMHAFRRANWNFSLDRALDWAKELGRPLVILETLPSGRRWDSVRHHRFALEGMAASERRLQRPGVLYYPFVESEHGSAQQAVVALCKDACVMVADDYPIRESREDVAEVARQVGVLVEQVDSNGLLPLRAADRVFQKAHSFRRFLQKELLEHLDHLPKSKPLDDVDLPGELSLPRGFGKRWPRASAELLSGDPEALGSLPIDASVPPSPLHGGSDAAEKRWRKFLGENLSLYPELRNDPDEEATSRLSPYLRFGHISAHQIFAEISEAEGPPRRASRRSAYSMTSVWGMSASAEAFLDELVTWRELGFNMASRCEDYDRYESLPDWAKRTLTEHAGDPRERLYSMEELDQGKTHDAVWNASQMQLVREGYIHNYLRMLWGKKILEWTASPQESLAAMIELNNKYALDGRDPNSYSGIFWVLGRYDRPWGPERPIFGTVRYMSTPNTLRKVRVKEYLKRFAPESQ